MEILLLRSNPSRQHSELLYGWGIRRRGKVGMKRKCWVFCSAFLFPARKLEVVTQGGTRRIDHPTQTYRADIVVGWEDERDHGPILGIFM